MFSLCRFMAMVCMEFSSLTELANAADNYHHNINTLYGDFDEYTLALDKVVCNIVVLMYSWYRSGTVNSNTVNLKFHLIRSYCEIFFYNFPNIPCSKYTVNSNFHLIRSKTLPTNDFELTVPDLFIDLWPVNGACFGHRALLMCSMLEFTLINGRYCRHERQLK